MQQKLTVRIPAQNAKDGLSHFELPKVRPAFLLPPVGFQAEAFLFWSKTASGNNNYARKIVAVCDYFF
ncbi:hypothetical protein [Noviherbaspirillum sp.]|uniref:hypothetical protein n=1 Tax=Noviherbaspirillum sp. TaxID=1926288 RepID=UPI002FE2443C